MTSSDRPTVLIVEDYVDEADLYAAWLEPTYDVRVAYSGKEALERLDDGIDAVLLDRKMPDMTGDAVLVEIQSRDPTCPVATVTGMDPDFDVVDLPVDDYLQKPVRREELMALVDRLLRRSDYNAQLRRYWALASRKAVIETEKSPTELEESQAYSALLEEISRLEKEVDELVEGFDDVDFKAAFRRCVPHHDDGKLSS